MEMKLTKRQFADLLVMAHLANDLMSVVAEAFPKEKSEPLGTYKALADRMEALEDELLSIAAAAGLEVPVDHIHAIADRHADETLWSELAIRLGQRDFLRTATSGDQEYMDKNDGMFPARVTALYRRYEREFDTYGIERLELLDGESKPRLSTWWS
jgi:hypothetical protein